MKTILFVRHAKSSWDYPDLPDFERPLNKRGLKDAPAMAKLIKKKKINPDIIFSSPAVRALTTAKRFAEELDYSQHKIKTDNLIYEYGPNGILKLIMNIDDKNDTVFIFGHNPDLTHLVSYMSGEYIENLPTCGVVCIDFNCDSWHAVPDVKGKVRFFEYPKKETKEK